MEQMKRQHSTVDDNKKRKLTNNLNRDVITCLEDISNEIIYEIFDFLDYVQTYKAFANLNQRFQNLITNSTFPIKIKLLSTSKSNFRYYHTQTLMPNQHRIKSLHLSNPFLIDHVFSSICHGLKLIELETLILNKIQSTYVEHLLKYLLVLPYLSTLIIDCEDNVENKNNLYEEIFRLPCLKYCKLSLNELIQSEPLPMATNEYSPIERLILISTYPMNDLNNLLSYIPHLKYLSLHSSNYHRIQQIEQYSSVLIHLTHVSISGLDIPFDLFEIMVQSLFNQVQVIHISVCFRIEYLDAYRWQRLILSHMPQLRIFDINIELILINQENIIDFIPGIEKFNSPFWSKQQWFFDYHTYKNQDQTLLNFYSTKPYRRKQYKIYAEKDEDSGINSEKQIMNSVRQLEIQNQQAIHCCRNYFPNITELIINYRSNEENQRLYPTSLNSIIPLNRLTKFILRSYYDDFSMIIKLLQYTPNIYTFTIEDVPFRNSNLMSIEKSETFQLVSRTNNIRNMIIHRKQTLNIKRFLVNLCPRLYQLSFTFDSDSQLFLQYLSSNDNHRLNYLYLLNITYVSDDEMKILKKFINSEKLFNQYSLQVQYNTFNKNMYLWW